MIGLPPSVQIYFATELTDMRKGIDGLRASRITPNPANEDHLKSGQRIDGRDRFFTGLLVRRCG